MSADSETKFLITILFNYGYMQACEQNCAQILARLCTRDPKKFLNICSDLIDLTIRALLQPIHKLPDNVLETIANDLHQILVPLWTLQMHNELVNLILNAQNMVSNAYTEKSKKSKTNYIKNCYISLNNAYMYINDTLEDNT